MAQKALLPGSAHPSSLWGLFQAPSTVDTVPTSHGPPLSLRGVYTCSPHSLIQPFSSNTSYPRKPSLPSTLMPSCPSTTELHFLLCVTLSLGTAAFSLNFCSALTVSPLPSERCENAEQHLQHLAGAQGVLLAAGKNQRVRPSSSHVLKARSEPQA